ncbi:MAG: pseudouridine synthase [Vicingaceae bacterium]
MNVHRHFLLNKPYGYLSQFINNKRRKKKLLGELYDFPEGVMAIGRLDVKSEGLLMLTTNGKLSQLVRSQKIEKEYWVEVDGEISEESIKKLSSGIEVRTDGKSFKTLACQVEAMQAPQANFIEKRKVREERHGKTSWVKICLREGKFHQVRKMTAAVGHPTLRLIRYRIGEERLNNLTYGKVKEVEHFQLTD